jgi:hypothetical protein
MRRKRCSEERLFYCSLVALVLLVIATPRVGAAGPALTTINDLVYRADGTPAAGTVLISWPAFQTAEAIANREIVDEVKFKDGLGKIVDGTVECLNASIWAKKN